MEDDRASIIHFLRSPVFLSESRLKRSAVRSARYTPAITYIKLHTLKPFLTKELLQYRAPGHCLPDALYSAHIRVRSDHAVSPFLSLLLSVFLFFSLSLSLMLYFFYLLARSLARVCVVRHLARHALRTHIATEGHTGAPTTC